MVQQRHLVADAQSHVDEIKWKIDDSLLEMKIVFYRVLYFMKI